ncbi:MAG: 4-(cytidine 5'-diphospho)-2-C-methyl-D-erythritol kinase [Flavobacteriales bacterium]
MIRFPFAKINLGLNVMGDRPDGFHEVESILVPIPMFDILEAVVAEDLRPNEVVFTRSGLEVPGPLEQDLCWRAAMALLEAREFPGVRLHLHKVIPMGAGLGGGSSDGAHALLLLNDLFELGLPASELAVHAAGLGSDCPFFLQHGPQLATGRGEVLEPMELQLADHWITLVNPGIHVSTAEVYAHTPGTGVSWRNTWGRIGEQLSELARKDRVPRSDGTEAPLVNTMERYVCRKWPEVEEIKKRLREVGAFHTAMSGSGSTVFGLFTEEPPVLEWPRTYLHRSLRLGGELF